MTSMSPSSSGSGPDPERASRRSRAALVVAGLIAALVVIAWMRGESSPSPSAPQSVAVAPMAEIANAPEVVASAASEPVMSTRPETVVDQVEVCDGFWVAADADGKPNQEAFDAKATRATYDTLAAALSALSASTSPRDQAAAAFLEAHRWASDKVRRDACREPGCARDVDLLDRPIDAGALDRLAQTAQATDDPQIYAWAYAVCAFVPRTPACLPIQPTQWARIDPGNAAPWLALAEEARQRKDAPGVADAMFHVGAAERYESRFGALTSAVIDRVPGGEANALGGYGAAVYVFGIEAATQPGWSAAMSYCAATELADANRSELCERIAVVLAEHADTALARGIGMGLAKRLGWSTERLRPLKERIDAEAELATARASSPASSGDDSCRSIQAQVEHLRDLGHYGELAARERAFDASGSTVSQLAAKYRQRVAAAEPQAGREAAASAAAAGTTASSSR